MGYKLRIIPATAGQICGKNQPPTFLQVWTSLLQECIIFYE